MKPILIGALVLVVATSAFAVLTRGRHVSAPKTSVENAAQSTAPGSASRAPEDGVQAQTAALSSGSGASSQGMAALERAAKSKKYAFVFFFKGEDAQTIALRKVLRTGVAKVAGRANAIEVNIGEFSAAELVAKYGVAQAPMPLLLAIAPNGAVTGGFPQKFEEKDIANAFVSPCMEKSLKALQDRKLVLLCAQNGFTKQNENAMIGVRAFKADKRFAEFTEVIRVDPRDKAESKFLSQLKISANTDQAVTTLIAPPGVVVASVTGAVDKDVLTTKLLAAMSGSYGSGSCGPSGCCPARQ